MAKGGEKAEARSRACVSVCVREAGCGRRMRERGREGEKSESTRGFQAANGGTAAVIRN